MGNKQSMVENLLRSDSLECGSTKSRPDSTSSSSSEKPPPDMAKYTFRSIKKWLRKTKEWKDIEIGPGEVCPPRPERTQKSARQTRLALSSVGRIKELGHCGNSTIRNLAGWGSRF